MGTGDIRLALEQGVVSLYTQCFIFCFIFLLSFILIFYLLLSTYWPHLLIYTHVCTSVGLHTEMRMLRSGGNCGNLFCFSAV